MKLRCPICAAPVDAEASVCAQGHVIGRGPGGVIRLMSPEFAAQVDRFEDALADHLSRQQRPELSLDDYVDLPARPAARGLAPWVSRARDVALVRRYASRGGGLRVLDLGAWNGWLSDALSREGHTVTAVSFFGGDRDGLGARRHFPNPAWTAIQMDEDRLDLIDESFDVVVVNRCLHAAPNPADRLRAVIKRLRPGGWVIATGLPVYADARQRAAAFGRTSASFEARYGVPYRLVPGRDWLSPGDVEALTAIGAEFGRYPGHWLRDWKARFRPSSPVLRYLVVRNSARSP